MINQNGRGVVNYLSFGKEEEDFFAKYFTKTIIPKKTEFFYEGQVPNVGFYLIRGSVTLEKYDKVIEYVHEGAFVGIKELITDTKSKVKAVIEPDSEIMILDKTTLKEIFNSPAEVFEKFSIQ